MKMTRKLIPALAMLLVSAIMLSTASFAWFASNNKVTATDMTVTVKTGASFLEISNAETGTYASSAKASTPKYAGTGLDLVTVRLTGETGKKVVKWYTGVSDDAGVANPGGTDVSDEERYTEVTTEGNYSVAGNYALINTFYVKMSAGSTSDVTNFKVSGVSTSLAEGASNNNLINAIKVLVVSEDGVELWSYKESESKYAPEGTGNSELYEVVGDEAKRVDVYIFFDGDHKDAYTNNTVDTDGNFVLDDVKVTVTFDATIPTT